MAVGVAVPVTLSFTTLADFSRTRTHHMTVCTVFTRVHRYDYGMVCKSVTCGMQARSDECIWYDGVSRCDRYWVLASVCIAFAVVDFCIAIVFAAAGRVMDAFGDRRCSFGSWHCGMFKRRFAKPSMARNRDVRSMTWRRRVVSDAVLSRSRLPCNLWSSATLIVVCAQDA